MSNMKAGWVGLGNMGTPIVKNLLKAGFEVQVYNRTREKEQGAVEAGALSASSLAELVKACDIIGVMVSDDEAVKEIFNDPEGLLAANAAGKLFINVSTVSPATSKLIGERCSAADASFIDAPVSGSVRPAQDGTLIIMAGGETTDIEKAKPFFDAYSKLTIHTGDVGSGSAAKLAINYYLGVCLQGLAETVVFARENGISTEDMLTIINEGALSNGITKMKSPAILKGEYPAAFALKHLTKDLRLATEQGIRSPLAAPLYQTFRQAMDAGLGDEDVMAIIKYLEAQ
ncbi:NAD(P)-dependent oxidoreductase [Mucilaginibacter sp. RS28]|uniref:NAD(P)-dependent oxidoreductase n=1 Tax=Mucilaginibacter straminoryzae TaxID=2932774 RepID=A0A9X2B8H0_9SPHI|nr:NAD(P)-dependent oxidoreductase [Mucilaginibacter straminoryzae]MCJ8208695.1 NAD(P)-dependent oxidoreductase [Mucilaginibacter straminoryzae]